MRTIKYIISVVAILSMTMGSFTNISGQDVIRFSETYKSKEIISLLDKGDRLFSLLNTDQPNSESCRLGTCPESATEALVIYLQSSELQSQLPDDLRFAWGWKNETGNRSLFALRESRKDTPKQEDLISVNLRESKNKACYDLLLTFSKEGSDRWARMTRENVGRNIAIVIDGKVVAAPMVRMEINQGKCMISGDFSKTEANEIKTLLEN